MNVYSVTIKIAATAYIKAETEADALRKAGALENCGLELPTGDMGDADICGLAYDDPELPEISLSPAMTMHGAWSGDRTEIELVHEGAA